MNNINQSMNTGQAASSDEQIMARGDAVMKAIYAGLGIENLDPDQQDELFSMASSSIFDAAMIRLGEEASPEVLEKINASLQKNPSVTKLFTAIGQHAPEFENILQEETTQYLQDLAVAEQFIDDTVRGNE